MGLDMEQDFIEGLSRNFLIDCQPNIKAMIFFENPGICQVTGKGRTAQKEWVVGVGGTKGRDDDGNDDGNYEYDESNNK